MPGENLSRCTQAAIPNPSELNLAHNTVFLKLREMLKQGQSGDLKHEHLVHLPNCALKAIKMTKLKENVSSEGVSVI